MTNEEYIFKDASNEELENLYLKFEKLEEDAGMSTTEGKFYSDNAHKIYDELKRRGEEMRGMFLILKRNIADTDTADIRNLHDKLESTLVGVNPMWEEDFTEVGDPISDAASIMSCFMWFLEIAILERGEKVR